MKHIVHYDGGSIGFRTKREADKFRKEEADAKFMGLKRSKTAEKHLRDVKQFKTQLGSMGGFGLPY